MTIFDGACDHDMVLSSRSARHLTLAQQRIMGNALRRSLEIMRGESPIHPNRLAYGGTIEVQPCGKTIDVPDDIYRDRLHVWFQGFLRALLAMFVLAVVYGYFAITP